MNSSKHSVNHRVKLKQSNMRREVCFILLAMLLSLLFLTVLLQALIVPTAINNVVAVHPSTKSLAVPAFLWAAAAIACWQAIGLIGVKLVMLARNGDFAEFAYGWLCMITYFLFFFIVLDAMAFAALIVMNYTTPGIMLGLFGGGLIAVIAVGSLIWYVTIAPLTRVRTHN